MTDQIEKPDRIGLRVAALIVIIVWATLTVQRWDEVPQGLILGWVIIGVVLWRLGKPDRERDKHRSGSDEKQRQELLRRLAADMRAVSEAAIVSAPPPSTPTPTPGAPAAPPAPSAP